MSDIATVTKGGGSLRRVNSASCMLPQFNSDIISSVLNGSKVPSKSDNKPLLNCFKTAFMTFHHDYCKHGVILVIVDLRKPAMLRLRAVRHNFKLMLDCLTVEQLMLNQLMNCFIHSFKNNC